MTELIVSGIHKKLGDVQVLSGASFTAKKGEIVALLGASGSGKTTLLRSIAGLEQPEAGHIEIGGKTVLDSERGICLPPERREIGLVFQSYALWPHKTVFDNVVYGLKLRRVPAAECRARVSEILERLGLAHLSERFPHQLSGGQQQRVALCRALVYSPNVLLLDEPLSNLDAKLRDEARFWIRQLILQFQICAVVVTHDQAEALAMSDHVLLLSEGRIEQAGTPQEIYRNPATLFSAEFMGANNVFKGRAAKVRGEQVEIFGAGWMLQGSAREPVGDGDAVTGVIRIERMKLVQEAGPNRLAMTVEGAAYMGEYWEYLLAHGDMKVRARSEEQLTASTAFCEFPPEYVWVYVPENKQAAQLQTAAE